MKLKYFLMAVPFLAALGMVAPAQAANWQYVGKFLTQDGPASVDLNFDPLNPKVYTGIEAAFQASIDQKLIDDAGQPVDISTYAPGAVAISTVSSNPVDLDHQAWVSVFSTGCQALSETTSSDSLGDGYNAMDDASAYVVDLCTSNETNYVFVDNTPPVNPDRDDDGILNDADNCPDNANADQADFDKDGIGDVCDTDVDGDTVVNGSDYCPKTPLGDRPVDPRGCSIAQYCPCDNKWKDHKAYVNCVEKKADSFKHQRLLTHKQADKVVKDAKYSSCGVKGTHDDHNDDHNDDHHDDHHDSSGR